MTYIGNTTFKHGADFGQAPVGTFTLSADEQIVAVDGASGLYIDRIGFFTSKGNRYGPYGSPGDINFRLGGPVYGFYGGYDGTPFVSGIGIWTLPSPTPPPSPSSPPPPPVPGRSQLPVFSGHGDLSSTWDDGALFTGQCTSAYHWAQSCEALNRTSTNRPLGVIASCRCSLCRN